MCGFLSSFFSGSFLPGSFISSHKQAENKALKCPRPSPTPLSALVFQGTVIKMQEGIFKFSYFVHLGEFAPQVPLNNGRVGGLEVFYGECVESKANWSTCP